MEIANDGDQIQNIQSVLCDSIQGVYFYSWTEEIPECLSNSWKFKIQKRARQETGRK